MRRREQGKITLAELLITLGIIVVLAWLVLLPMRRHAIAARQARCRNNLNQLAKGLATYLG